METNTEILLPLIIVFIIVFCVIAIWNLRSMFLLSLEFNKELKKLQEKNKERTNKLIEQILLNQEVIQELKKLLKKHL